MQLLPRDIHPGDRIDYRGHVGTVKAVRFLDVGQAGWHFEFNDATDLIIPASAHVEVTS